MVFKFEIGWNFESSVFGRPGFFRKGEMSASLNFDGNAAWVKDKFARCEMRMEMHMTSVVRLGCNQAATIC